MFLIETVHLDSLGQVGEVFGQVLILLVLQ